MVVQFKKNPGDRILELGGGDNPNSLSDVCVDIRPGPKTHFQVDFNEFPWPIADNDFEGIFSQYCLEHVSFHNVPGFLAECFRIIKPGGRAAFVVPNTAKQLEWIAANQNGWDNKELFEAASELLYGSQDYPENSHRAFLSPQIAVKLFADAGFRDVRVQPYGERDTDMVVEATKLVVSRETIVNSGGGITHVPTSSPIVPPNESKRLHFHDRTELYDKFYFNGGKKVGGYANEGYRDFDCHFTTANHVLDRKPESVLEIGCGRGYILKRLQDRGIRAAGLEISKHCWLTRACDGIALHDLCKTPWPYHMEFRSDLSGGITGGLMGIDDRFDVCFSIATLEHIPEEFLPAILGEMKRTCRRGLHGIDFGEKDDGFDKTHCFPAGTLISMSDGSRKPIEQICYGDEVLGVSNDGMGKLLSTPVNRLYRHRAKELVIITLNTGGELVGTPEHPVMVPSKGWTKMQDLAIGDEVTNVETFLCSDAEANQVYSDELSEYELQRNVGEDGDRLALASPLCRGNTWIEEGPVGADGMDGSGKAVAGRQLPQVAQEGNFEAVAQQEMAWHHAHGPKEWAQAFLTGGIPGSIAAIESYSGRSRLYCGHHRRGGFRISIEGNKFFSCSDMEARKEWKNSTRMDEGMVGQRGNGVQHGSQDDRLHQGEMWGHYARQEDGISEQKNEKPFPFVRAQHSWISCFGSDPVSQAVHDYEEGGCGSGGEVPCFEDVQGKERKDCGGGVGNIPGVATIVSAKRVSGMGVEVFNLETSSTNYFANGMLVHNCTLRPYAWWRELFDRHGMPENVVAQGDKMGWVIVDKEELERGAIPESVYRGDGRVKLNLGCVAPETLIHTIRGYKRIDEIQAGEYVLTHRGRFCRVNDISVRKYVGKIHRISVLGMGAIRITPEHPVYAVPDLITNRGTVRRVMAQEKQWVKAKDIRREHFVFYPHEAERISCISDSLSMFLAPGIANRFPNGRRGHKIPRRISADLCRMIGYYLAEGGVTTNQVSFSFHSKEKDYIDDVRQLGARLFGTIPYERERDGDAYELTFSNIRMAQLFLELGGKYSEGKRLDRMLLGLDQELQRQILVGAFRGDGSIKSGYMKYTTVSTELAQQIKYLLYRQGILSRIKVSDQVGKTRIWRGRVIKHRHAAQLIGPQHSKESVSLANEVFPGMGKPLQGRPSSRNHKDGFYGYVRDVSESDYDGPVWNMEVDEDNTYVTEIGVVHNSYTTQFHHGWTNIDLLDMAQFAQQNRYDFKRLDVRQGLPYPTGGVDAIFLCHFLEHLDYGEGLNLLRECRRVIKPAGGMRIIVPNAELLTHLYRCDLEGEGSNFLGEFDEINDGCEASPTPMGKLWSLLHAGHAAAYDSQTLAHCLDQAGFNPMLATFRNTEMGEIGKIILKETIDMQPEISLFMDATPKLG